MQPDEIPELPGIKAENYPEEDQEFILCEIKKANRKLIFYEAEDGQFLCIFSKLDHIFYAQFLAVLSRPGNRFEDIFTFLKLCLEGVRLVKQCTNKGYENAVRIEKFLKKQIK